MSQLRPLVVLGALTVGCLLPRAPLADLHPVVWAAHGQVGLHTCRWPDRAELVVELGEDAEPAEVDALDRAVRAWNDSELNVRMRRARGQEPGAIRVRFVDEPLRRDRGGWGAGRTVADCRRDPVGQFALEHAELEIARRVGPDWRGEFRLLETEERLGVLVHELGHALGHPGHVKAADGALVAAPEALRRLGRRVAAGRPLVEPALRRLYSLPSGSQIGGGPVDAWRTDVLDAFLPIAARFGLHGPWLRSGDVSARIFWKTEEGRELGLLVLRLPELRRNPSELLMIPESGLRAWLQERSEP